MWLFATSPLLVKPHAPDADGTVLEVTPQSAGWTHVGFAVVKLAAGQRHESATAGRETCLVVVAGTVDVVVGDARFDGVGGRASPFEDRAPGAVYIPTGAAWSATARDDAELAVCTAPASGVGEARLIDPARMSREVRGSGTNTRHVRNILPQDEPAESLLVVEVITPGGHWSSYPPHKHDTATAGEETSLEETYYHRLQPAQGFAIQRVYTDDRSLGNHLGGGWRRGVGAARLPPGRRAAWLRPVLPQRDGGPAPPLDLPQRPGARLDHQEIGPA